jgi:hypothetical protein
MTLLLAAELCRPRPGNLHHRPRHGSRVHPLSTDPGPGYRRSWKLGHTDGYTAGMSKVMVSLPDELLARIDLEAKRRSTSRSALLAVAASRELERRGSEEIAQAIARSEERFRQAGPFDAADVIRLERDSRK